CLLRATEPLSTALNHLGQSVSLLKMDSLPKKPQCLTTDVGREMISASCRAVEFAVKGGTQHIPHRMSALLPISLILGMSLTSLKILRNEPLLCGMPGHSRENSS